MASFGVLRAANGPLLQGAAIEEGTLRIGDRLLEVNGVHVTGYSQADVAALLRQIPVGGVASLIVSRQEKINESYPASVAEAEGQSEEAPSPKLPRQIVSLEIGFNFGPVRTFRSLDASCALS